MVAPNLSIRDRILKTIQIQDLPVSINQIARKCDLCVVDFCQPGNGSPSVPRRFDRTKSEALPFDGVTVIHPSINRNPGRKNFGGLLTVIVKSTCCEFIPEIFRFFQSEAFAVGGNHLRARFDQWHGFPDNIPAPVCQQQVIDAGRSPERPAIHGQSVPPCFQQDSVHRTVIYRDRYICGCRRRRHSKNANDSRCQDSDHFHVEPRRARAAGNAGQTRRM